MYQKESDIIIQLLKILQYLLASRLQLPVLYIVKFWMNKVEPYIFVS